MYIYIGFLSSSRRLAESTYLAKEKKGKKRGGEGGGKRGGRKKEKKKLHICIADLKRRPEASRKAHKLWDVTCKAETINT